MTAFIFCKQPPWTFSRPNDSASHRPAFVPRASCALLKESPGFRDITELVEVVQLIGVESGLVFYPDYLWKYNTGLWQGENRGVWVRKSIACESTCHRPVQPAFPCLQLSFYSETTSDKLKYCSLEGFSWRTGWEFGMGSDKEEGRKWCWKQT